MVNKQTSIRNLQIITAFDSLSFGLLYQSMSQHIHKLGGTHLAEGVFAVSLLVGELLSREITKRIAHPYGKKNGLLLILSISLLTHLLTVMTKSVRILIFIRMVFSAVNQTKRFCYGLLLENEQNLNTRETLYANYAILSGSGYILGPVISGYLLQKGIHYGGILASFFITANIILLMYVDSEHKDCRSPKKSLWRKLEENVAEKLEELEECDLKTHWDILLVKYLFSGSILIFFSKFAQILHSSYDLYSPVALGYTTAYMNGLVFASRYLLPETPHALQKYPLTFASEILFFFITVSSVLACFAPNYRTFMALLIPIVLLRTTIMTMWKDLFSERRNNSLEKLNEPAGIAAGLTAPLLFGWAFNKMDHRATLIFTCIPLLLSWIIIKLYSKSLQFQDQISSDRTCDKNG